VRKRLLTRTRTEVYDFAVSLPYHLGENGLAAEEERIEFPPFTLIFEPTTSSNSFTGITSQMVDIHGGLENL